MTARLPHRLVLLLAAFSLFPAGGAPAAGVEDLREEARDLFEARKYAESARRWLEVAALEAAAADASRAYWAYWRAAICETKTGDFTRSAEHFALADGFLQTAKAAATGPVLRTHRLNEVALRNGWETACFDDGRIGLGYTVHQRASAALADYLRDFRGGGRPDLPADELTSWLDVQLDAARYHEVRGDLAGAIAVMRAGLEKAQGQATDPAVGREISRMKNNLANFLSGLGDDDGAEKIYAEGLAGAADGAQRDRLRLNLARLRSQIEGPSKECSPKCARSRPRPWPKAATRPS
jgi:tetratricopeptide (TPR) repeat protein